MSEINCSYCYSYGECNWIEFRSEQLRLQGKSEEEILAFKQSGFDPPCVLDKFLDNYDDRMKSFYGLLLFGFLIFMYTIITIYVI